MSCSGKIPWLTRNFWISMRPVIACRIVCGSKGNGPGRNGRGSGNTGPNGISFGSPSGVSGFPFSVKAGFVSTSMLILILGLPVINETISHNFIEEQMRFKG